MLQSLHDIHNNNYYCVMIIYISLFFFSFLFPFFAKCNYYYYFNDHVLNNLHGFNNEINLLLERQDYAYILWYYQRK